jgi:hypothetical protein
MNKTTLYSHAGSHIMQSSKLIIAITSRQMEDNSSRSQLDDKKHDKYDAREAFQF